MLNPVCLSTQSLTTKERDVADVSSHIAFKEKCRAQAETVQNYKACDELTQEIPECKGRKRELEKLKLLLLKASIPKGEKSACEILNLGFNLQL